MGVQSNKKTSFSLKFALPAAALAGLFAVACSGQDPEVRINGRPGLRDGVGAGATESGGPASFPTGPAAPVDAGVDPAANFRDPRVLDAGCASPNALCPSGDGGMLCVAITEDPNNCGACGTTCLGPTAACTGGACRCGAGYDLCNPAAGCQDVTADPANCGRCGNACPAGQTCQSGACS